MSKPDSEILTKERVIWGLPCKQGETVNYVDRAGILAKDFKFRGILLPENSAFSHDIEFDFLEVELARETDVYGHKVDPGTRLTFSPRAFSGFRDGRESFSDLFWITLRIPIVVPFLPIWGMFGLIGRPFNSGKWMYLTLNGPAKLGPFDFIANENVYLKDDGSISEIGLSHPLTIQDIEFQTGFLAFDKKGQLKSALLYENQEIQGIPCLGSGLQGTEVLFFPDGKIKACILAEEWELEGKKFPKNTKLDFTPGGKLEKSSLAK